MVWSVVSLGLLATLASTSSPSSLLGSCLMAKAAGDSVSWGGSAGRGGSWARADFLPLTSTSGGMGGILIVKRGRKGMFSSKKDELNSL